MWRAGICGLLCSSVAFAQGAVAVPDDDAELPTRPADPAYLEKQLNYQDTTVTIEELPPLQAKWQSRKTVRFGGVVPVALCGSRVLHVTFIGPVAGKRDVGSFERFQILPASESAQGGNCFESISSNPRHRGPIHAAIRVRPSERAPDAERVQVVLYNPPSRQDIVLVATRPLGEAAWIPLVRIDMSQATRIHFIQPGWH